MSRYSTLPDDEELPMEIKTSFAEQIPLTTPEDIVFAALVGGLGVVLGLIGSFPLLFCFPYPFRVVPQGKVGLISRWGKYFRTVDPGLYKINPLTDDFQLVDVKIQVQDIAQQYVMSKDNVHVRIDSVLYWHIVDPYVATFNVADVKKALMERTQTTLRHIIGTRTLQDAIENRNTIAEEILHIIDIPAKTWGVKIEQLTLWLKSILIKDLLFSQDLQETLSSAAKQKRVGESKVIAAQAEVEAAKLMREASDILNTPAAMQIRYLETLSSMSKSAGTKVIFMPQGQSTGMEAVVHQSVIENM
ncbi:hypothetical protein HK096_003184 [Nowakowskiella sp. JEL0078]|nr:hypothetical protein HK096_003184 [Nowakowskiella sp. JEL0078]